MGDVPGVGSVFVPCCTVLFGGFPHFWGTRSDFPKFVHILALPLSRPIPSIPRTYMEIPKYHSPETDDILDIGFAVIISKTCHAFLIPWIFQGPVCPNM